MAERDRSADPGDRAPDAGKSADRAKLSILTIGVAFFSSILCMCLAILIFVAL